MSKLNWSGYAKLMRMDKPIGTYLLLWPTLWALFIAAQGMPSWDLLLVFSAGVFVMRSAGCVINDYADRHVDGDVARTAARPLATGQVTEKEALFLFVFLIGIALGLVLMLNWQTFLLAFGALLLAVIYPFMKRFTHLPQVVLGAAFSWSIPMAFMATNVHVPQIAWWLYAANLLWTVAYDTEYAMVDRQDDLKVGIKSTAILFGRFDKIAIGALQLATLVLLIAIGLSLHFNWIYWLSVFGVATLFIYQQVLIGQRDPQKCFKAFLNNHYAGMILTLGIALSVLL